MLGAPLPLLERHNGVVLLLAGGTCVDKGANVKHLYVGNTCAWSAGTSRPTTAGMPATSDSLTCQGRGSKATKQKQMNDLACDRLKGCTCGDLNFFRVVSLGLTAAHTEEASGHV